MEVTTAGFVVSNVALVLAGWYLLAIVERELENVTAARLATALLFFGPASFFFSIFYTESLFLFLATACGYYARKRQWAAASGAAALCSAVKVLGVLAAILVVVEIAVAIRAGKAQPRQLVWTIVTPLGALAYFLYLDAEFGNASAAFDAAAHWGRRLTTPLASLASLKGMNGTHQALFTSALVVAGGLVGILWDYKARRSYTYYATAFLLLNLSTGTMEALPRHVSVIFPLYLAAALVLSKRPTIGWIGVAISAGMLCVSTAMFVTGHWFT